MLIKNKTAFTLSEVLITLTIIGLVASMTIPSMFQKASEDEFRVAFKKNVSRLSQAAYSNYAMVGINFSRIEKSNNNTASGAHSLGSILKNRTNVISTDSSDAKWDDNIKKFINTTFVFADNSMIGFNPSDIYRCYSLGDCTVYVDVNGTRPPNKLSEKTAKNDKKVFADQFKIYIYGNNAAPADEAARYALYGN